MALVLALTGVAGDAGTAVAQDPDAAVETIPMALNQARRFDLPAAVRDVVVANPEIADVIVKKPNEVYLVARGIGDTNVFFVGGGGGIILHVVVHVDIALDAARAVLAELLPEAEIKLKGVNGSVVLTGTVGSARDAADAAAVARRFVAGDDAVINMLRVLGEQQVLLRMRVAEVQRNALKTLGATTSFRKTIKGRTHTLDGIGASTGVAANPFGTVVIPIRKLGFQSATFSALERRGLVKTLAEPALMAISGETANFLAGGEFPVPTGRDNNGNLLLEYKEFGVSLSFTPVVLANGGISLRIKTEVSRLSEENTLTLVDTVVKGLSVRRAESTVTLSSGGSLMIAGLLQSDEFNTIEGLPWLKDIPILGALFRSQSFQNNQTELVVLVTAYLVRQTEPGTRLAVPSDGFVSASDFDIFLLGRLHRQYSKGKGPAEIQRLRGPFGYIME